MKYLKTRHEQKSAVLTAVTMFSILMLMLSFGMRYVDPPEEYGVAINFGSSDIGSGIPEIIEEMKTAPKIVETKPKVSSEKSPADQVVKEEVLTQNTEDAPVIQKKEVKKTTTPVAKDKPKKIEKPVVEEAPKPSKETEAALSNLFNGNESKGTMSKGEGDDAKPGLKGNEFGDPNSSKYYGNNGSGGDKDYTLSGRNPLSRPVIKPDCNEEGIVVVIIEVDKSGKVVKATPGAKGSNNTSPCLLKPAMQAALRTTWNADNGAPLKQIGRIVYRFSLSE